MAIATPASANARCPGKAALADASRIATKRDGVGRVHSPTINEQLRSVVQRPPPAAHQDAAATRANDPLLRQLEHSAWSWWRP